MRTLAGRDGRAADVDGDRDVGLPVEDVEGQRIGEPAIHEHAAVDRDGREQRRQRDAGRDRGAQRALGQDRLLLGVVVGGHDLERDLEVGEVARHRRGQHELEQRLGIEQGGADGQDVEDLEHRLRPGRQEVAGDAEALAQRLLGVRPDELGRESRCIGGAEDGADRGAGDDLGPDAQLVEHLQHQDVGEPARPSSPSASAIVGRPTGREGLRTCRALPGGFMGAVIPGLAPSSQPSGCIGSTGWQGDGEWAPYLMRPASRGSVRLISGMQIMSVSPISSAQI